MAQTIQLKRGTDANFGDVTLAAGEPAFITDEGKLFVGDGGTKVLINPDLGTAALLDTGTASGNIPVLGANGKLAESVIPVITADMIDGGSGTTDHTVLVNRDAADQHPVSAVTGLGEKLGKLTDQDGYTRAVWIGVHGDLPETLDSATMYFVTEG